MNTFKFKQRFKLAHIIPFRMDKQFNLYVQI